MTEEKSPRAVGVAAVVKGSARQYRDGVGLRGFVHSPSASGRVRKPFGLFSRPRGGWPPAMAAGEGGDEEVRVLQTLRGKICESLGGVDYPHPLLCVYLCMYV